MLQLQRSNARAEQGDTRKPIRLSICYSLRTAFFSLFRFAVFSHGVIFATSLLAIEHEHHQCRKRYVLVAFQAVPRYLTRVEAHRIQPDLKACSLPSESVRLCKPSRRGCAPQTLHALGTPPTLSSAVSHLHASLPLLALVRY